MTDSALLIICLVGVGLEIIEIWVPEAIIVFFLVLPLVRPFFKGLWPLDGLVWLPPLALGIAIGIFPAYGFRPECFPILVFTLIYNLANLSPLIVSIASRPSDTFHDRGYLSTILTLFVLSAAAVPMFAFPSRAYEKPENETEAVKALEISHRVYDPAGYYNRVYSLRVYGAVRPNQPLIFLVPPEMGSAASIDMVCTELQKKNFTVVTYFFKDYDFFRKRISFFPKLLTYWHIFSNGTQLVSANEQGKALEVERRTDVEFLLPQLPVLLGYTENDNIPLLLAGYGAGGSALAYLAGESGFVSSHNNVLGVAAVESRLWSSYLPEVRSVPRTSASRGIISRHWNTIVSSLSEWFNHRIRPQRVSRMEALPSGDIPALYIISDRALDSTERQNPYRAVLDCVRSSSGPVVLVAIEGAGPLDYQDFPITHPIFSYLFPGRKDTRKSSDPIGDTAGIIGNFASLLLFNTTEEIDTVLRQSANGRAYVESKGLNREREIE